MQYLTQIRLSTNQGNNALSYHERVSHYGKAEITLPSLKTIQAIHEISLGKTICLEEIDESGKLLSCSGLSHVYDLKKSNKKIVIVDNHNHVLYFWMRFLHHFKQSKHISLIHIDQHSDLNVPSIVPVKEKMTDLEYIWEYTNYSCQISSFIKPFLERYPETNFTRIKSEAELLNTRIEPATILDIDLDFRAPEMSIEKWDETIMLTRQLIRQADLITLATSPMFLDQERALKILQELLDF